MAKLDDVTAAIVARYGVTTQLAQDLIARGAASEWGVFREAYPELNPGDEYWTKMNVLLAGMPYEPKT
jgi:hypothetical protein